MLVMMFKTPWQEYVALVDRFYEVSEHLAPHQYEVAKKDFEYFMRLVDLAVAYYGGGEDEGNGLMGDEG